MDPWFKSGSDVIPARWVQAMDAAVVLLNGGEVWRDMNFAPGTITNQTPALMVLGGADETNWLASP